MKNKPKQNNIPNGWEVLSFDQVISQVLDFRGKTPLKLGMNWGGSIPALSANNVKKGYIDFESECHMASEELYSKWMNKGDLKKGDIVFTMEAPLGNVAIIPDNKKYLLSQRVVAFRFSKEISSLLMYHYLLSDIFQGKLNLLATGSTAKGINQRSLSKIKFLLPSLIEQNRIVTVLETWDRSIESLTKKLSVKKQIKLGLKQDILTGKKRLSGFKGNWKTFLLKDVSKIYDGTHQTPKYVEKGIPFYSVEHVTADNFLDTKYISEEVYETESKKVHIERGDILMTRIGSIGAIKYVDWDAKASFYVTLALLKVNKEFDSRALSFFLTTREFQDELYGKTLHVAFPIKINLGDIGVCKIKLPEDIKEQKAIAEILTTADKEITELEKKLSIIKEQKKYLLNNLITGTIRTPETLSTKLTK